MNNIGTQILELQSQRDQLVSFHDSISNIWFSTKQQLINVLSSDNLSETSAIIFLDNALEVQQKSIAYTAMSLLPSGPSDIQVISPNEYSEMIDWLQKSEIEKKDFIELFQRFWYQPYINFEDAIDQIWPEEAYKYIEMCLARKKFIWENIQQENKEDIIIQSSHVKWINGIFTKWETSQRSNRNNLFMKVEYNRK